MKLRRNKKGFTIIELVIVIAVIGILAAVLIPTFVNLTNKANEAADNALVNNLNKALKMEEQEPGHEKSQTLEGAIKDLEDQGYILENLASKSGKDLLWSQSENQFLLNTEGKSGKDYWKIVDAVPAQADQKYSYYAGKNFNQTDVTVKYGFDAGRIDNIGKVTYVGTGTAQEVAIRTSGFNTALTVNAPSDTVHHYNYLDELTVTAVAGSSYHEHGKVRGKATISAGHFVVENNSQVPQIDVVNATSEVKVTAKEETLISADATSSAQSTVVAEASNVFISGISSDKISGSQASTVKLPTSITTEAQLIAAIAEKKPFLQLGANFEASEAHVLEYASVLDFAGYTITSSLVGAPFITNNSNMKIVDTGSEGGIVSANNNIIINNNELLIENGKFAANRLYTISQSEIEGRTSRGVINNAVTGTITINNVDVYVKADFGFLNFGNATINGGSFKSDSESGAFSDSRWAYCVSQYGEGLLTINNVTIQAVHGCIGINGGKAVINNANASVDKTKNSYYGVYIAGEIGYPEVTINGGTFTGKTKSLYVGNKSDGGAGNLAMANVYGGTFNGGISVVLTSANNYGIGMLKVYGGQFGVNPENISGHSVVADGYKARNNGNNTWTVIPE